MADETIIADPATPAATAIADTNAAPVVAAPAAAPDTTNTNDGTDVAGGADTTKPGK